MSFFNVEQVKWVANFITPINAMNRPYMVTGSFACIVRGEPRVTVDVDSVIQLERENIDEFLSFFPEDRFYCPPREIIENEIISAKGQFNIVDNETGMKADIFICRNDPLHTWGMQNRKTISFVGFDVCVAPSEYVIIRKLEYFKEGGSSKHLRDIYGLVKIDETIDMEWLKNEISKRGLEPEWKQVGA